MVRVRKLLEDISLKEYYKNDSNWRLKLDLNENIYGVSPLTIGSIKNVLEEDVSNFPKEKKFKEKIALTYNLSEENVIPINDGIEALDTVFKTYLEKDEKVLLYNPFENSFYNYAKINEINYELIKYEDGFEFSENAISNSITEETKVVYLELPDRNFGNIIKASAIETLLKNHKETLFFLNASYISFSTKVSFLDYVDLILKYDNLILFKSFSFDYSLAGLRVGFMLSDKENILNLSKVKPEYNVNSLSLNSAIVALNDKKRIEKVKELNFEAKQELFNGLKNTEYCPYFGEGNFLICDFKKHTEFYYNKFIKNGIIVKKYPKNTDLSSFLRITVPKMGGVKYILELLNKKDFLVFDLDGTIFDVRNSSIEAIKETYQHFSGKEISTEEILDIKNLGGMDSDYRVIKYLLSSIQIDVEIIDIMEVYKKIFYMPEKEANFLIDNEKMLISKETLEELSKKYDMAIFSNRSEQEIEYSLKKFEIDKYFYYVFSCEDISKNNFKPNPNGMINILEHCPYKMIKYIGDCVDDIIIGNKTNVETVGIIPPYANNSIMVNNFRHLGTKYILNDLNELSIFLEEDKEEDVV